MAACVISPGNDPLFFVRLDPLVADGMIQWFIRGPEMFRSMHAPKKTRPTLVIGAKISRTLLDDGWDAKTVADQEERARNLVMQLTGEEENICQWSSLSLVQPPPHGGQGSPGSAAWPTAHAVFDVGVSIVHDALANLWICKGQRHQQRTPHFGTNNATDHSRAGCHGSLQ